MTKKNWGLLITLVVLIGVFGILLTRKNPQGGYDVEGNLFSVADTSQISKIQLTRPKLEDVTLIKTASGWQLNNNLQADAYLVKLMLSVLNNVQVKRPVARSQRDEILQKLQREGVKVEVYRGDDLIEKFLAGGIENEQLSYFADDEEVYVVQLPGYVNYISGVFTIPLNSLRNKVVYNLHYTTFRSLELSFTDPSKEGWSITFDGRQLNFAGVNPAALDSGSLFTYLDHFDPLEAYGYVNPNDYPDLDSLLKQEPIATFKAKTLADAEGKKLQVYPKVDNKFQLAYLPEQKEAVLFDQRLIQAILVPKSGFLRNEK